MRKLILVTIFLLLSSTAQSLYAVSYTVTDLGFILGKASINNNGQVTGWRTLDNQNIPTLWENGSIKYVGMTSVATKTFAWDINDAAQIVGQTEAPGFDHEAFLWQKGKIINLGTLPGNTFAAAFGINNVGQVVGVSRGGTSSEQAFIWENGVMTGLGTLGGSESSATAINDLGQVVGFSLTINGAGHPFLWEKGNMIDLGVFNGNASPQDINNSGKIVGGGVGIYDNGNRAMLWDKGKLSDLGILPGFTVASIAFAINNNDQIVGQSKSIGRSDATLWQNGSIFNLNDLIEENWHLISATDINDAGEIVGDGINPKGVRTTFLLTPTREPISIENTKSQVKFKSKPRDDEFSIKSKFILYEGNNCIDPVNKEVEANSGTSSILRPVPFSFEEEKAGVSTYKGSFTLQMLQLKLRQNTLSLSALN